jgi:hypothetical protein
MGMTDEEVRTAEFDLEQDHVRNARAQEIARSREVGEWGGLREPKLVTDAILDADALTAAWLWAKEHFVIPNADDPQSCMGVVIPSRRAGFDLQVDCFDKHTVAQKTLLIRRVGDLFKVAAVIDAIFARYTD